MLDARLKKVMETLEGVERIEVRSAGPATKILSLGEAATLIDQRIEFLRGYCERTGEVISLSQVRDLEAALRGALNGVRGYSIPEEVMQ